MHRKKQGKVTVSEKSVVVEIGLLMYPGFQTAAVHGLTDLFSVANRLAAGHGSSLLPTLRVSHWQAESADAEPQRVFDSLPGAESRMGAVVIPPSLAQLPPADEVQVLARWVREQHGAGAMVGSVCIGAFVLGLTGLLGGRTVTTHWTYAEALSEQFPDTRVEPQRALIDDGDILTSAGLMAWSEMGLRLIGRILGPSLASSTARYLVIEHSGSAEACGSHFAPILSHGDAAVLKVQHWLQSSGAVEVSLSAMATLACLEERTFLRRFRAATGLKPTEYCQHVRVGKAREMLEFTHSTVDHIAWTVGYQDPGAFRSTFKKVTGLSPSDYRKRFGVTNSL